MSDDGDEDGSDDDVAGDDNVGAAATGAGVDDVGAEDDAGRDDDAIEPDPDALPPADLVYPTLSVDGDVAADGAVDATADLDRDAMAEWLRDVADALTSHDLAVAGDDRRATFGIAPDDVAVRFEPDEDHRGVLDLTFSLRATVMTVDDADKPAVGARGGRGFVPLAMLADDEDCDYRCYNWIEDPTADETGDGTDEWDPGTGASDDDTA